LGSTVSVEWECGKCDGDGSLHGCLDEACMVSTSPVDCDDAMVCPRCGGTGVEGDEDDDD